jgi:hypothetical protein
MSRNWTIVQPCVAPTNLQLMKVHNRTPVSLPLHVSTCRTGNASQLLKSDGMRRPVSDGMLYAPKLSTCSKAQEIKETGNEEG